MELVKSDRYVTQSGKEILDTISPHQEAEVQNWFQEGAKKWELDPNIDDPRHFYNYRAAHKAGIEPELWKTKTRVPYESESKYFKENPQVAGMATEDDAVILNPYRSFKSGEDTSVRINEAARVYMNKNNISPSFDLTKEQKEAFKNYGNENQIKQTIAARIIARDPSSKASKEQIQWTNENVEDPLTHWSSQFKSENHPNRYVSTDGGFIDTKTGKPYVPNPVSTITGKPTTMDEELRSTGERGINSNILSTLDILEGTREDPRWQMAAWQKGVDPSTKLGILKGLATDIINLPKDKINPTILRHQYKALHKVPAETITENVDRLAFVPELTRGAKQSYIPDGQIKYTWGDHTYSPLPGTSSIRLNPGTAELTHPNQVSSVEYAAPWNRTAVHEVAHAMTINPDNLMKIEDPIARKYMRQLIKSSDKQPYTEKSTERISKEMESWQKSMEGAGTPITPTRLKKHLTESIKREAVLQEIKEMRKITDYGEFKKELPKRIKTWTRDDHGAKGKKWYDNFFRKSETSTEDLFDYK